MQKRRLVPPAQLRLIRLQTLEERAAAARHRARLAGQRAEAIAALAEREASRLAKADALRAMRGREVRL